jgi:hypothetical protein
LVKYKLMTAMADRRCRVGLRTPWPARRFEAEQAVLRGGGIDDHPRYAKLTPLANVAAESISDRGEYALSATNKVVSDGLPAIHAAMADTQANLAAVAPVDVRQGLSVLYFPFSETTPTWCFG